MKIIVIGGTGTLGSAVVEILSERHQVISVGFRVRNGMRVDIEDIDSIDTLYQSLMPFDAVVATTGNVHFGALDQMTDEQCQVGLQNKLMGQVNLVLRGLQYINENGSFTLTSGILNHDPIRYGASAAMVNGAIDGFVKSAAIELPKNIRINAVSPTVLQESMDKYAPYFRGFAPVSAKEVALAFCKSVEGAQTGQIYRVGYAV